MVRSSLSKFFSSFASFKHCLRFAQYIWCYLAHLYMYNKTLGIYTKLVFASSNELRQFGAHESSCPILPCLYHAVFCWDITNHELIHGFIHGLAECIVYSRKTKNCLYCQDYNFSNSLTLVSLFKMNLNYLIYILGSRAYMQ